MISRLALVAACLPLAASQLLPPSSPPPPGTLVVVPPAGAGIFADPQFLNPHAYGPNEIATQNWVRGGTKAGPSRVPRGGAPRHAPAPHTTHALSPRCLPRPPQVYEGLVSYGQDGAILPALATSWQINSIPGSQGVEIVFELRQGVTFHDGAPWNAAACKQTFDNVFAPAMAATYHSWYALPSVVTK